MIINGCLSMNMIMSNEKRICEDCKGNGYIRVKEKVEQCIMCYSEGEIDESTFARDDSMLYSGVQSDEKN